MPDDTYRQAANPLMVQLELDGDTSVTTRITPLGDGRYRLEETEWMVEPELNHHDIIEAEDLGSTRLRFIRVIQRSNLLVASAVLSPDFLDSAEMQSALAWLTRQGGYWQRDLGGCLSLSIPKDVEPDFRARWDQVADLHKRGLTHPGGPAHKRAISFTTPLEPYRKADSEKE